jgi:predicted small secreted protein
MKTSYLSLCAAALLSLSACGTLNGAGVDLQNWGNYLDRNFGDDRQSNENAQETTFQQDAQTQTNGEPLSLKAATDCPNIILKPMMSSLIEFQNPAQPSNDTIIAKANLTNAKSNCNKNGDFVTVSLDLDFAATLGPKAKQNASDKPSFSFPYFISVTDYQGNELAREVFAASFSFAADQNQHNTIETIEQKLPLSTAGTLPNYYMEIGFELTDEQMAYNNANRSYF